MQKSKALLKTFGGATLRPLGECELWVTHREHKLCLKFQVVKTDCKPLLSAETCEKLGLIQVNEEVRDTAFDREF